MTCEVHRGHKTAITTVVLRKARAPARRRRHVNAQLRGCNSMLMHAALQAQVAALPVVLPVSESCSMQQQTATASTAVESTASSWLQAVDRMLHAYNLKQP